MYLFRNVSIRTKLAACFGLALALLVAVGLFGLIQLQSVFNVTLNFRDVWLPRIELLGEIKRITAEHKLSATRRVQTTNFRQLAAIAETMQTNIERLKAAERAYGEQAESAHERELLDLFNSRWSEYLQSLSDVQHRLEIGELTTAYREFNQQSLAIYEQAAVALDQLIAYSNEQSSIAAAQAGDVYSSAILLTIGFIVFAAIGTLAVIAWISRNVSRPILRISDAMRRLSAGDETGASAEDRQRRDEVGTLAEAVEGYRTSLTRSRQLAAEAEQERARLDAAISNMPIGLSMFDSAQQLIVCNNYFSDMYHLPPEATRPGTPLADIMRQRMSTGDFADGDPEDHFDRVFANIRDRKPSFNLVELKDGRSLNIIHQPMASGGWVAIHEDITERRRTEARIRHMARHDPLTDLANRVLFRECVEEAVKQVDRGQSVAVLCLDLDRFKSVNDTLGHPVGDAVLVAVADRLRACVREADSVARFGGDEFAVLQVGVEQPTGSTALGERIIAELSAPYEVDGHQVVIGASIGISLAPADSTDCDQLLKNGDMALYRAKCEGRGIYRFFEPEMDARMQARRILELDLRQALAGREFALHYQPIINLETNEVTCFEALLRWQHSERGTVAPSDFIPLAEEIGLIVPIGDWVIRQACHDAAKWPGGVHVSVNISPVQFRSKNLVSSVISALAAANLSPRRLELEITEGVLLNDHEATLATLFQLRALGVHIAMDDFGTGYSSLSYLRSFPFDKIKIDQSFIGKISAEESSLAIIRAVTGMSASLGIATTAEGVETEDQLARLRAEGCTEVQGFLFSAARPADKVAEFLEHTNARAEAAA